MTEAEQKVYERIVGILKQMRRNQPPAVAEVAAREEQVYQDRLDGLEPEFSSSLADKTADIG